MFGDVFVTFSIVALVLLVVIMKTAVVVPMRESVVLERLGRFKEVLAPGFHILVPFIDRVAYRQEMREQVLDIPAQSCITRDNIQVAVDGLVYLKVMDAEKASYGIHNYRAASVNLAQTTMRSEVGKLTLDHTFSERDSINENIVREIDKASDPWGIKVMRYEIRNITPSYHVTETLEKQMEAERQKRARITLANAERDARINVSQGERQEAVNLSEGERQRRINEAEGRAEEMRLVAGATAEGIKRVSAAIRGPGGKQAVRMRIVEQFIGRLGEVLKGAKVSVVPADLANIKGVFEGLGRVTTSLGDAAPIPPSNGTHRPQAGR